MVQETEVRNLSAMIDFQEGAVVSKALIKQDAGNVTLFAFDKGEELSEHTAPYDAFVYILDGSAELSISGTPYTLEKGQMIIMPANEPHALKAPEQFKMLLVMVRSLKGYGQVAQGL